MKVFLALGFSQSKKNKAIFFFHKDDVLIGLLVSHVDDFLHAGTKYFREVVISDLRSKFQVGATGKGEFRYTGINIKTHPYGVEINQNHYVAAIQNIPVESVRQPKLSKVD